jgi:hypothetical protein
MKRFSLIFALLVLCILSCEEANEKEIPKPDVYEIKNIGTLSTTEYTIGKVIQLNDSSQVWYKPGHRKILIRCEAKVKAGIDLTKLSEGDITIVGNTITIKLPPSEITSFTMDPNRVQTEMESATFFRDKFTQQEKHDFMEQGEVSIREDLQSRGIFKDAEKNATRFLKEFYEQMGFEKVIVEYDERED